MAEDHKIQAIKEYDVPCRKIIVAAIDFGSAYSGYAFSFQHEYKSNPVQISCNNWQSAKSGFMSLKTPTVLLLDPKKNFHKFGYDAEDKYAELTQMKQHKDWFYFTNIKMKLMNALDTNSKDDVNDNLFVERLTRDVMITDMENRDHLLIDIMRMSFKYLVDHLLNQLEDKGLLSSITPATDILWVLTVPAIWTDASKQFTKEAAIKAGLSPKQVILAYEPEAAALFCRLLPVDRFISGGENKELVFSTFERGKKFMVLDLGGWTVDISVQETTTDGQMKSIHKVCGGQWGGYAVDEEFRQFIIRVFGGDVFKTFKDEHRKEYLSFFRDFEMKKRQVKLDAYTKISMRIPAVLSDLQEDSSDCTLSEILKNSKYCKSVTSFSDKLLFTYEMFESFFLPALSSIIEHVTEILKHERCQGLSGVLLVGGFAESEIAIKTLRHTFPTHTFIVPNEAGLSVVKGAVLYGHDPNIICARTCRYTYGSSTHHLFDETHPLQRRLFVSEIAYCRDCFDKTFTIGEMVNVGDKRRIDSTFDFSEKRHQKRRLEPLKINVLITVAKDPKYADEPGVEKLGDIEIPLDDTLNEWPERFHCIVFMEIAGTEIEVTCELETGHRKKARFEFLTC